VVAAILELLRGWRPTGDDAVITFRAWGVFSSHPPLLGQATLALSSGLSARDLGPLEYWLLAVPVHLDPSQGALWGAALICAAGVAIAVNAAFTLRGPIAAMIVVGIVAVVITQRPQVVLDPVWNPDLGLVCFIVAGVLGWVVASGRFAYWPWMVLFASVAAQCHLMFAFGVTACCLVALVLGLLRARNWRWTVAGLVVGVACWLAPLLQEVKHGDNGNISRLSQMGGGPHALGLGYGLKALASVVTPRPTWMHGASLSNLRWLLGTIDTRSPVLGACVVVFTVIATVIYTLLGRRSQAMMYAVLATLALSVVATVASYPIQNLGTLAAFGYVDTITWPVGLGVLAGLAWVLWDVGDWAIRHRSEHTAGRRRSSRSSWQPVLLGIGALVLLGLPTGWTAHDEGANDHIVGSWQNITTVRTTVARVEASVPHGRIDVMVGSMSSGFSGLNGYGVLVGLLWELYATGYRPATSSFFLSLIGPQASVLSVSSLPEPPIVLVSSPSLDQVTASVIPRAEP